MGGAEKTLAKANEMLDRLTKEEGKRQNVDEAKLNACIEKQDDTAVKASINLANDLGIGSTPMLFINGERLEGALPVEYVYRMIDKALVAAGQTPPPPVAPTPQAAPAAGTNSQPANRTGSQQ
jgi:hypothetical protein